MSEKALELIKALRQRLLHGTLVFPSPREKVLSDTALTALLRRVKAASDTPDRVATAHGFRSSFRDWASEHGYARDLAERALAHTVKSQVEAAYHRTDLLDSDDHSRKLGRCMSAPPDLLTPRMGRKSNRHEQPVALAASETPRHFASPYSHQRHVNSLRHHGKL
ncbi:tyrosine-type recombinase/integrase [Burkholderia multivorans]|uniref:tyrosine-type recombinase/integrase n=1 Tax=Burkholderia multivorans TaxID=87883 RepID=UPI001F41BA8F|nr:tyrosine-type recombinase/integrase [Burkholderia multivorans]